MFQSLILFLAGLVPCGLLLLFPDKTYSVDWLHSVWQVGVFQDCLKNQLSFPHVYLTENALGLPFPIFYGYLLYPVLGLLSLLFSPQGAIICLVFLTYQTLAFSTYFAAFKQTKQKFLSFFLTGSVLFSLYPLTNLYQRSALPEFFATQFLFIAFSLLLLYWKERTKFFAYASVFFLTLSGGSHPLTLLFGFPCYFLLGFLVFKVFQKRDRLSLRSQLPLLLYSLLVLSAWIYATFRFRADFPVVTGTSLQYFLGLDSVWGRLLPIPYDYKQRVFHGMNGVPDLHAPVSLGLLLYCFLILRVQNRRFGRHLKMALTASSFLAVFFFLGSTWAGFDSRLHYSFLSIAQFAYRFATYINFSLLVFCYLIPSVALNRTIKLVGSGVLLLSLTGAIWKQVQMKDYFPLPTDKSAYQNPKVLPSTFYGRNDYAVAKELPTITPSTPLVLPIDGSPLDFILEKNKIYGTNVALFPWNQILTDAPLIDSQSGGNLNIASPFPSRLFTLQYVFVPNPLWLWLKQLGFFLFFLNGVVILISAVLHLKSTVVKSMVSIPSLSESVG